MSWRMPLRVGGLGVAISIASLAYTLLDAKFNFFHNPTVAQLQANPGMEYREPRGQELIDDAILILNPGTILEAPFSSVPESPEGERIVWGIWVISVIINFVLYFLAGLLLARIIRYFKARATRVPLNRAT
jgi:hypothetical protein